MGSFTEPDALDRMLSEVTTGMADPAALSIVQMLGDLDGRTLAGAQVYLGVAGPSPQDRLAQVLASHLEVAPITAYESINRLVAGGKLQLAADTVSLPAGSDIRDTEENPT